MDELEIKIYGNPVLRKKAKPVEAVGPEELALFDDMAKAMYAASGVGLAAPQVGVSKQLIVIDAGRGLIKLANPKIIKAEGKQAIEEGCLSFPEISIKIKRANNIVVEALGLDNKKIQLESKDLTSIVLQHEIDHLTGTLIVDRASLKERIRLRRKLTNLRKRGKQQ